MFTGAGPGNALFVAMKTMLESGYITGSIVAKNSTTGNPERKALKQLGRGPSIFCSNFRLVSPTEKNRAEAQLGALDDRLTYVIIPQQFKRHGDDEMTLASTKPDQPALYSQIIMSFRQYGLWSLYSSLLSHVCPLPKPNHLISEIFLVALQDVIPLMTNRQQQRWRQQTMCLVQTAITGELESGTWNGPDGKPIDEPSKAAICAALTVASPEACVLSYWLAIGDISSINWKRHALDCLFGGRLLQAICDDDETDTSSAVTGRPTKFRCGTTREELLTKCADFKRMAIAIVQYLNSKPNCVNPGIDSVTEWLRSLGHDSRQMAKVAQITLPSTVKNRVVDAEHIVLSREMVAHHLTPLQKTILKVARSLFEMKEDAERRYSRSNGHWILELSTLDTTVDTATLVSNAKSLGLGDAAVIDDPFTFETEGMPDDLKKHAASLLVDDYGSRVAQTAYMIELVALSATKLHPRTKSKIFSIKTEGQTAFYTELPDSKVSGSVDHAMPHPFKKGRHVLYGSMSSCIHINPDVFELIDIEQASRSEDVDPQLTAAFCKFYDVTGIAKLADGSFVSPKRYPLDLTKDLTPKQTRSDLKMKNPRYKPARVENDEFNDEWVPEKFEKQELGRKDVSCRFCSFLASDLCSPPAPV